MSKHKDAPIEKCRWCGYNRFMGKGDSFNKHCDICLMWAEDQIDKLHSITENKSIRTHTLHAQPEIDSEYYVSTSHLFLLKLSVDKERCPSGTIEVTVSAKPVGDEK